MYQRKRARVSAAERSLANKAAGRIGRLAALFHLLWCLAERAEGPISLGDGLVGVEAMQRAIRFNRFLLNQTVGVRLTSAGNSELGALMLRLQRVAWEKKTPLSLSMLRRALSGKQRPESTHWGVVSAQTPVLTREERDISSFLRGGPRDGQGAAKPWQGVEKSLVDCFRHRRRLGMEPVLEALKDAINQRRLNVDELWQQAQAQRMKRVMAPYLEALL